jgi:hypothetical protein
MESVMTYVKILSWHLPEETEKNHEKYHHRQLVAWLRSNWVPPECESDLSGDEKSLTFKTFLVSRI